MQTNHFAILKTRSKPSWMQQLLQFISAPVGNSDNRKKARSHQSPKDEGKEHTRSPELAPPQAVINSQTLAAFSDYADEYEPTNLTFAYLIPHELSLLNLSIAQENASAYGQSERAQTSLLANHLSPSNLSPNQKTSRMPTTQETNGTQETSGNDEDLLALIPPELAELSLTVL